MKRLALGELFPLENITRRRCWRGFQISKEAIVTPDGISVRPGSLRQLTAVTELLKLQSDELSTLKMNLWKLTTACGANGIRYRDFEEQKW